MDGEGSNNKEVIIALYNKTCAEITRYRNREWQNQGVFTAAMMAIIGFILANHSPALRVRCVLDGVLVLLAVGNVFYTGSAHIKLTVQRNILSRLRKYFDFNKLKVEEISVLPDKWFKDDGIYKSFLYGWSRGFLSHLLPFWIFDLALIAVGIYLLHSNALAGLTS